MNQTYNEKATNSLVFIFNTFSKGDIATQNLLYGVALGCANANRESEYEEEQKEALVG